MLQRPCPWRTLNCKAQSLQLHQQRKILAQRRLMRRPLTMTSIGLMSDNSLGTLARVLSSML